MDDKILDVENCWKTELFVLDYPKTPGQRPRLPQAVWVLTKSWRFASPVSRKMMAHDESRRQELKCIWQIIFICSIKCPQCTDKNSKKNSIAIFLLRESVKFHFRWGTKPRDQNQETDDVISGLEASRKTDFSVIFILWANKFVKKWRKSALFIRK